MPVFEVVSGEVCTYFGGYDNMDPSEYGNEYCVVTARDKRDARGKGVRAFRKMKCDFLSNGENPYYGMKVTQIVDVLEHTEQVDVIGDDGYFNGEMEDVTIPLYTVEQFVKDTKECGADYWFDFMEEYIDV